MVVVVVMVILVVMGGGGVYIYVVYGYVHPKCYRYYICAYNM